MTATSPATAPASVDPCPPESDPCPSPWAFDAGVTEVFEQMLQRSIPNYQAMRQVVTATATHFRTPSTAIIDLGASTGEGVADLVRTYGATNRFVLIDESEAMVHKLQQRYGGYPAPVVQIRQADLRSYFPECVASVVLSVLTLQFIPLEYRPRILEKAHARLVEGGAFILVEKVLGGNSLFDELMVREYYRLKQAHGYSVAEIEDKRAALERQMIPLRPAWNEDLLRAAGFSQVTQIWQWMNFRAWVAVK